MRKKENRTRQVGQAPSGTAQNWELKFRNARLLDLSQIPMFCQESGFAFHQDCSCYNCPGMAFQFLPKQSETWVGIPIIISPFSPIFRYKYPLSQGSTLWSPDPRSLSAGPFVGPSAPWSSAVFPPHCRDNLSAGPKPQKIGLIETQQNINIGWMANNMIGIFPEMVVTLHTTGIRMYNVYIYIYKYVYRRFRERESMRHFTAVVLYWQT